MTSAKTEVRYGNKALGVMVVQSDGGWLYFAEVIDRQNDGVIRIRATNPTPFPTQEAALETGMAYARWLVAGQTDGYDPGAEVATEIRTH